MIRPRLLLLVALVLSLLSSWTALAAAGDGEAPYWCEALLLAEGHVSLEEFSQRAQDVLGQVLDGAAPLTAGSIWYQNTVVNRSGMRGWIVTKKLHYLVRIPDGIFEHGRSHWVSYSITETGKEEVALAFLTQLRPNQSHPETENAYEIVLAPAPLQAILGFKRGEFPAAEFEALKQSLAAEFSGIRFQNSGSSLVLMTADNLRALLIALTRIKALPGLDFIEQNSLDVTHSGKSVSPAQSLGSAEQSGRFSFVTESIER